MVLVPSCGVEEALNDKNIKSRPTTDSQPREERLKNHETLTGEIWDNNKINMIQNSNVMLEEYDIIEKKGFDEYDVQFEIKTHAPNGLPETSFEMLALTLVFSSEVNDWGTHYGPVYIGNNAKGERVEVPSRDSITVEAVQYWSNRYKVVQNPILKVRYCGLVWDYYQLLPDQRKPSDLYEQYTNALLDVVRGEYFKHRVLGRNYLQYTKELLNGNTSKCNEWKAVLHDYVLKEKIDSKSIGIWYAELDIINNSPNLFTNAEKQASITLMQQRYNYFKATDDIYLFKDIVELMFEYYRYEGNKEQARVLLSDLEQKINGLGSLNPLQKEMYYELIAGKYRLLGNCKSDEERIMQSVQSVANDSVQNLQKIEIPFEITKEQWDEWLKNMMSGDIPTIIERFLLYFVPNKENEEKELEELAKAHPFQFLIPTKLHIGDMPGSVVLPYEQDKEGHLVLQLSQKMQISDVFMVLLLRNFQETNTLTNGLIEEQIKTSVLVPEDRKSVMVDIVELYFEKNYVAFCHQVIPQIEAMIRTLLIMSGINVLKPQRGKSGFQLRTLDELLHETAIDQVFCGNINDKSFSTYLRVVLTDQRGCNYRNLICHGIINPAILNEVVAGRLLHIMMLFLKIKDATDAVTPNA